MAENQPFSTVHQCESEELFRRLNDRVNDPALCYLCSIWGLVAPARFFAGKYTVRLDRLEAMFSTELYRAVSFSGCTLDSHSAQSSPLCCTSCTKGIRANILTRSCFQSCAMVPPLFPKRRSRVRFDLIWHVPEPDCLNLSR